MAAIVDLVNAAVREVAGNRITSLTDGTKNANAANDIYLTVLDDLLASHDWKFATRRVKLARSATTPASGFDYGYALPSDWIRTTGVFDNDEEDGNITYREGELNSQGVILTDATDVYLVYVYRCTDPNRWSADFVRSFIASMASKLAVPIANSNTLQQSMGIQATRLLNRAKSKDAMGSTPLERPKGTWATVRNGWGR